MTAKTPISSLMDTRYGRLVVVSEAAQYISKAGNKLRRVACRCDCGTTTTVTLCSLTANKTISCGCFAREKRTRHGLHKHKLYNVWNGIVDRCTNESNGNYHNYGGRGISLCEEWKNPEIFIKWALLNGWRAGLDIDRENNDDGYYPENCRFVSKSISARNTRGTGKYSKYRGVSKNCRTGRWVAQIMIYGKQLGIGYYGSELDALRAYNYTILKHFPANPELFQHPADLKREAMGK